MALVPSKKVTLGSQASMVYRYDHSALRSWTAEVGGDRLLLLSTRPTTRRDAVLRLQVDYVEKCVPVGSPLSLPGDGGLRYFVVAEKHPTRKKLLQSSKLREQQAMDFPNL